MNVENKVYIHFGADHFEPTRIQIQNNHWRNKPMGGFWGTPEDSPNNWKSWCLSKKIRTRSLNHYFRFRLFENAKVFFVNSEEKEQMLPLQVIDEATYLKGIREYQPKLGHIYDFEALKKNGYDAVEISITECPKLFWSMYGWDCDSIVVLNADVVDVLTT